MPVNNALTPEGSNALGAAFGYYPQLRRNRQFNDREASAEMPLQALRGRLATTFGMPSDILNTFRSPMPMEMYGQTDYAPQQQVPYGSQELMQTLPLPPQGSAQQMAGNIGAVAPLSPAEILQTARLARKAAMAGGATAKQAGRLVGEELNAAMLGERPNTLLGAITPKPMFAVEPNTNLLAQSVIKPRAEVSPLGFYSAVEQQSLNIPRKQGTGVSFLNDLSKGQDVKKYEIEAMGLEDFLKNKPNVTRQEVQDFIANNRINLQERVLSGRGEKSGVFSEFNPDKNQFIVYGNDLSLHGAFNTAQEADKFVNNYNAQIPYGPSKYDKYQLPGGENYREILLKLPPTENVVQQWMVYRPNGASIGGYSSEEYAKRAAQEVGGTYKQGESLRGEAGYRSSHWNEPNVLAHMRVNDRVDAEGKKMLLIEEVQSDWHQAGREKGYASPADKKALQNELNNVAKERNDLVAELSKYEQQNGFLSLEMQQRWDKFKEKEDLLKQRNKDFSSQPPDAPFKDTWHQLALKRAIKEAVDKGYDRIGLTTGAQQASRYDLSKQVDELLYKKNADGTYQLSAQVGGRGNMLGEAVLENKLSDYVGKEVANKIIENAGKDVNLGANNQPKNIWKGLSGIDLKVGGEGMKKYYDEIYPNFLNKFGKKYGAQVGETKVDTVKERAENSMIPTTRQETVRYLDITPEMRKAVKAGQPLASITNNLANAMA